MSTTLVFRLACDHPGCDVKIEVVAPYGYGSSRDLARDRLLPAGWVQRDASGTDLLGCPGPHAAAILSREKELYEWAKAECDARNAWMKKNKAPKGPAWLKSMREP